ncbi:VWA domain-containing protein [Niveibacterium sp.]|uniref:vWA domain-containing protein n=1 Tax=Niveibacterium sp. TaxID=2017444 RepID=UPI0035B0FB70
MANEQKGQDGSNDIGKLKQLRRRLAKDPADWQAKRDFHEEKARLEKLGVSPREILGVIHGDDRRDQAALSNKDIAQGSKKVLKDFTVVAARPLPVIVLADVSGSMSADGKIETLNRSLREMVTSFANEDALRAEVHVGVITFGGSKADAKHPLAPASKLAWDDLKASGKTPLGSALTLATNWLEDKSIVPSRAYMPTLVLVSDGQPDKEDAWQQELQKLLGSQRGAKAQRLALAIGADADEYVLNAFVANPEVPVLHAQDAAQISRFFRFVTMSVCSRLASVNPDIPAAPEGFDLENFEDF